MKYLLLVIATFLAVNSSAQSGKVIGAWKHLNDYYSYKELASLNKAKESIDLASENPETKGDAKTWLYRGKIYQALYEQTLAAEMEKLKESTPDENKRNLLAYQNAAMTDLEESLGAYSKSRTLDVKKSYLQDNTQKLSEVSRHFENRGIALYNVRQFADALPAFENAIGAGLLIGETDTSNINNAALVADKSKNYEKAKIHYQKLVDMKYGKGNIYTALSTVYQATGDTAGAFAAVKKGRIAYPDDVNLIIAETNFYLKQKKTDDAINNLKLAIQKRPTDPNLYLVLGNLYDNMANPKDASGKDMEKPASYDQLFLKAEENYKKSIELKPDYFDGLYNIGVLYNNKGVAITKKADAIKDQAKYKAENAKANEEFNKALPYLEKAKTLNSKDRNLLIALKQLYARTSQADKLKEVDDLLKN